MLPPRGRPLRRLALATLLLTPIYYAVPWRVTGFASELVGVPFVLLYTVLLPGSLMAGLVRWRPRDRFEKVTTSAMFGLGLWLCAGFVWALSGITLGVFRVVFPVVPVAVAIVAWTRGGEAAEPVPIQRGRALYGYIFAVVLAAIFVLVLTSGFPIDFSKDTLDHAGYVREIQESGRAFPNTAFYIDPGRDGFDIRKGLIHAFYGYASSYLGIDAMRFLVIINAVFSLLYLLTVYSMTLIFFADRRVAVLAALLFLVGAKGGLVGPTIRLSIYPSRFGVLFYFYYLTALLACLRAARKRDLLLCVFFAFAASATHVFYTILVGAAGLVTLLWKPFFPGVGWMSHLKRLVLPGIASLAGVLPCGLYRYLAHFPSANELHTEVQGVVFLTNHLYIAQPWWILDWWGPIGVASIFAILPLWGDRRSSPGLGYVMASYVTVPLVLLNPFLLVPLHHVMTYLAFRLILLCPFYVLTAYYLVGFFEGWPAKRPPFWTAVLTSFILFACLLAVKPIPTRSTFAPAKIAKEHKVSHLIWQDGLDYLAAQLPSGSVVVSDPVTSYTIPVFTSSYVVCTLDQHAPPNDLHLEERFQDARDILSPFVSIHRTTELLETERATHVILNDRLPPDRLLKYWAMDSDIYRASVAKFADAPGFFELVFDRAGFTIFRWSGEVAAAGAGARNPFFVKTLPSGYEEVGREAGEAVLEGARLGPAGAHRGDELSVGLVWRGDRPYRFGNYIVVVRLDHTAQRLPFGGRPFPKLARKLKEATSGRLYRFRADHKIENGFLSPDTWPSGQLVLDEAEVRIPSNVVPGVYAVFVKLVLETNKPNVYLRDLFYDKDTYQGIRVGEISIE